MPTTQRMIIHWPSYFAGILAGSPGASPWEVLNTALRHASPQSRPNVMAEWRAEYPMVVLSRAQRGELSGWGCGGS